MFESRGCRLQCGKLMLNIPISVAEILVPQIAREHYQTLWNRIGLAAPTANKRGGESVSKIIKAGMRTRSVTGHIAGEVSERALDCTRTQRTTVRANEKLAGAWEAFSTNCLIAQERLHCRRMQRQNAGRGEFGGRDTQRARHRIDILVAQTERFTGTQSRTSKQSDQRAIGDGTQIGAPRSEGIGSSQNELNLIIGINVWGAPARRPIDETRRRNLGVRIECGTESGKASNDAQPTGDRYRKGGLPGSPSQSDPHRQRLARRSVIGKASESK